MKKSILLLTILISISGFSQQVLQRTNTASNTNKSIQYYRQNSPTNLYGNSFVLFEVNYDSMYIKTPYLKIDIADNRMGYSPLKKYLTADNFGNIKQGSFDSLMFPISQVTNLNSMLLDRPTFSQVSGIYQPIGSYLLGADTISLSNRIDSKQNIFSGLTTQYVRGDGSLATMPTNNIYNAGFGISKTGTEPSASFAINTVDIMTVNRASDSISSINTRVNGKVSASTTLTINGTTQDLSTNRTWSNVGIELPSQTGNNGKYLQTNGSSTSWQTISQDQTVTLTAGKGISITGTYPNFTISIVAPAINIVSRTLNSNFTPSVTKETFVSYALTCTVTNPLLVGTSSATAFLEYSINGGSTWLLPSQNGNSSGVGVTVTLQLTNTQTGVVSGWIPANALCRIRTTTSGTATVTYVTGQETNW